MKTKFLQTSHYFAKTLRPFLILSFFLIVGVQSTLYAQLNLNVGITSSAVTAESGEIYSYSIFYSTQSPTLAAINPVITIPFPSGMELVLFQGTSHVDNFSIVTIMGIPTLEINLINPLSAGSAGIIDIKVKIPAGTVCDGTPLITNATFVADNADNSPVVSGDVTTIISAGHSWDFSITGISVGPPGQPSIFAIDISPTSPTGYVNLQGISAMVELPTDAVFLACDGGCVYDIMAHALTWNLAMITEATTINYSLDIPDVDFDPGDTMNQSATFMGDFAFGCPGGPIDEVGDLITIIPMPFSEITCTNPSMTEYEIGKTGKYRADFANSGTLFEDNFTFTMTIPEEIEVTNILPSKYSIGGIAASILYTTNLNATPQLLGSFVSDVLSVGGFAPPALGVGEYLVSIIYDFGTVPPGFTAVSYLAFEYTVLATDQSGNLVIGANQRINPLSCLSDVNAQGYTCITINTTTSADGIADQICGASQVARKPLIGSSNLAKSSSASTVVPGDELFYKLRFRNCDNGPFTNVAILDQLPPELEFLSMEPIIYGGAELTANLVSFTYDPIANTLNWDFSFLSGGASADSCSDFYEIIYKVRVPDGTPPGQLVNCYTVDWDSSDLSGEPGGAGTPLPQACNGITVSPVVQVDSKKGVKGDCDLDFIFYDPTGPTADPVNGIFNGIAQTFQGGTVDYKMVIENTGNVAISEMTVIDILPWVGDQTVSANFARLSEWRPNMMGEIIAPAGVAIYYSLEPNPCRTEFNPAYNPIGCTGPNWSTTPPVDITKVQAIKLELGFDFMPLDLFEFTWKMRAPIGTSIDIIAWNSFAFQGKRMDTGDDFIVAEPNKVGFFVKPLDPTKVSVGNYVWVDKNGNGLQDDDVSLGLNSVKTTIYSVGNNGIKEGPGMGDDVMVDMVLTADDFNGNPGYYLFTNLDPGSYYVVFDAATLPPGASTALLNQGIDDTIDSDADATNMFMTNPTPVLAGGDEDITLDMGIMMTPCELFPEVRVVCDNRGTTFTSDDKYFYYYTIEKELGGIVDNTGTFTVTVDNATTLGNTAIFDIHTGQNYDIEEGSFGPYVMSIAELYLSVKDENDLSCETNITVKAPATLGYANVITTNW